MTEFVLFHAYGLFLTTDKKESGTQRHPLCNTTFANEEALQFGDVPCVNRCNLFQIKCPIGGAQLTSR